MFNLRIKVVWVDAVGRYFLKVLEVGWGEGAFLEKGAVTMYT